MAEKLVANLVQLDTELEILLGKIKTAEEGHIITSDYHNSLRDALVAIAKRIGGTGNSDFQWKVFTFAPNLLPINQRLPKQFDWKVTFNKAVVLDRQVGGPSQAGDNVRGAFSVALPDDAKIQKMTVRFKRLGDEENPKEFSIKLNRLAFDDPNAIEETLIDFDLKTLFGFKETREVKSAGLGQVDNTKYLYYVSAVWISAGSSDTFQINTIQIFCDS